MWAANEIVQGDSGQVVSNKLDAEFQRIQTWEGQTDTKLNALVYTDLVTILNASLDKDIVTPYTFWAGLNPYITRITNIEKVSGHLSEQLFDGEFWVRSDVMFEYSGAYKPFATLSDGKVITKAHIDEFNRSLEDVFLKQDGTDTLATGYVPSADLSIATKEYVDDREVSILEKLNSGVTEYPPSSLGDKVFNAAINGKPFMVFKNGIYQRQNKYSYNTTSFTFVTALDDNDEITITILGDSV